MSGFDDLVEEVVKNPEMGVEEEENKPVNHIAFIMDHSGSMSSISKQTLTGFNEMITEMKTEEQSNYVTLIEFDSNIKVKCKGKDIYDIKKLDSYWLGGMTALYDSIMLAISSIENEMPKDGNHAALINIFTDGYENASVENGGDEGRLRLKNRITELQNTGKWTFVFMGADQDVLETAVEGIGIYKNNTVSFSATSAGVMDNSKTYRSSYRNFSQSRIKGNSSTSEFFNKQGDDSNDNKN